MSCSPSIRLARLAGALFLLPFFLPQGGWAQQMGPESDPGFECPLPGPLVEGFAGAMAHVRYLADDALEGRGVASEGERCAGDYLATKFAEYGVQPGASDGSFFHVWEARLGTGLGADNRLVVDGDELAVLEGWFPLGYSTSGAIEGTLALPPALGSTSGQGASPHGAPAGDAHGGPTMDLAGKILVIDSRVSDNPHASPPDPHQVVNSAAQMGAAGVLILLPADATVPDLSQERRATLGLLAAVVVGDAADKVAAAAKRGSNAALHVEVHPTRGDARNVVGVVRGEGPHADDVVVVGAHYDHLGLGGQGSLSPNDFGIVHNGADDNASGTAVLLEVAKAVAEGPTPSRTVVFVAFTGEERGLWGSARYVEEPSEPLSSIVAMLNMDMVGRLQDGKLTVMGTATAEEWKGVLADANDRLAEPLDLALVGDGFGASDHSSFYAKGIPVLHFFTNTHPEYHRVSDDWELINAEGMERVSDLVEGVVRDLARITDVVALTPVEGAGNPHGGGDEAAVSRTGFNVRLGTIPDYSQEEGGMRITGVREGSPAAKAGIQGGDVIIKFGEREIEDVYGYMYALSEHKPGDEVDIVVLRDGEELTISVVLEGTN